MALHEAETTVENRCSKGGRAVVDSIPSIKPKKNKRGKIMARFVIKKDKKTPGVPIYLDLVYSSGDVVLTATEPDGTIWYVQRFRDGKRPERISGVGPSLGLELDKKGRILID